MIKKMMIGIIILHMILIFGKKLNMKKVKFYKTESGQWYIDLPYYLTMGGHISHLLMVAGADTLLDLIDNKHANEVYLEIFGDNIKGYYDLSTMDTIRTLYKKSEPINLGIGCTYTLAYDNSKLSLSFLKTNLDNTVWLCPTTLYVFDNKYPDKIYFRKITKEEYEKSENKVK